MLTNDIICDIIYNVRGAQEETNMVKIVVLIPLFYNDGAKVDAEIIDRFEDSICKITGGLTLEGVVQGTWMFEGKKYKDLSNKYVIGAKYEYIEKIKQLVLEMKVILKQEAMYFEVDENTKIMII